jgi:predicted alpha/beta-hydrolase family hydrolase
MPVNRILLAPGASGDPAQLRRHRDGLAARGYAVENVELPRGQAERAIPAYREAVGDASTTTVIGGQSFGGRVATLLAADEPPAGVVCFSYPLHAPGRQPTWAERTAHWPRITCPVLLLSGESDPFADIALLRGAVEQLSDARLITYPGLGHSLVPVLEAALDEVAAFIEANT